MTEYAAKTYLVPLVLKTPITPDEEYEAGFCSKCINAWKEIDRERAEKGIISVRAAIWSSVLPNCDVLLTDDSKTTIVAWKKNYNNAGLLDNSDQSAVLINGDHFSFLGYATIDQVKEIFIAYPDLVKFCVSESAYQSEEHCIMDGYELAFESEEKRLYVKSNSRGICSYAEIEGFC